MELDVKHNKAIGPQVVSYLECQGLLNRPSPSVLPVFAVLLPALLSWLKVSKENLEALSSFEGLNESFSMQGDVRPLGIV